MQNHGSVAGADKSIPTFIRRKLLAMLATSEQLRENIFTLRRRREAAGRILAVAKMERERLDPVLAAAQARAGQYGLTVTEMGATVNVGASLDGAEPVERGSARYYARAELDEAVRQHRAATKEEADAKFDFDRASNAEAAANADWQDYAGALHELVEQQPGAIELRDKMQSAGTDNYIMRALV